jgi:hypothetical protein
MSRITGSDALKMFEAYNAVYAPQEIDEEQVEEEEKVVEDVEQLDEMGQTKTTGQKTAVAWKPTSGAGSAGGSGSGGRRGSGSSPGAIKMPTKPTPAAPVRPAATTSTTRPATTTAAPVRPVTGASTTKPAAPSAGPKVAPTKPAGSPMQQWAKANPKLATKVTPSGERAGTQMGTGQSTMSKQAAELRAMRERISAKPIMAQKQYDVYDLVLEYLLETGHAATIDEAHYLMIEMDGETLRNIAEAKVDKTHPEHKRSGIRLSRYDNPSGALALGGGQQRARRAEHEERRGKKPQR